MVRILVEHHRPVDIGVKEPRRVHRDAAARAAVQVHHRHAIHTAVLGDVQLVEAFDDDADPGNYDDGDLPPDVMNEVFARIEAVNLASARWVAPSSVEPSA